MQTTRRELERSLVAAQEDIARLKSKYAANFDLSSTNHFALAFFILYFSNFCIISAMKDREERYRLHFNCQFETLSDAKNIEEQVSPLSHFQFVGASL